MQITIVQCNTKHNTAKRRAMCHEWKTDFTPQIRKFFLQHSHYISFLHNKFNKSVKLIIKQNLVFYAN